MITKKITVGFVIQTYNDKGECTEQEFVAGDQVDWENEDGEPIDTPCYTESWHDFEYQPFDMVQPQPTVSDEDAALGLVSCKICKRAAPRDRAHRHQGAWVGDECCWDERLRSSE